MDVTLLSSLFVIYLVSMCVVHFLTRRKVEQKIQNFKSLNEAIKITTEKSEDAETILAELQEKVAEEREKYEQLDAGTKDLQLLRENASSLAEEVEKHEISLEEIVALIGDRKREIEENDNILHDILARVDLYSRVDEFVEYGHFELPEYLYETTERFVAEIKVLREKQKELIKNGKAFVQEGEVRLVGDSKIDGKTIEGQMKLLLRAFNIECDTLIGKVGPASFDRTLDRIEKLANDLEKLAISLRCGISPEYVKLKYEECGVQYQFTLIKKEEQEEQRLIREQMREEARAEKEYRDALIAAEKEEKLYRSLLEKAKKELEHASAEERALAEAKISELEEQLAEAEANEERAKSLAEQTRRGHVYVISNIGSFGEDIYKIGMTRRLDPMDRVKELGDASVPFAFDVHAIIYTEDAPSMERELHRKFSFNRVNAVNLRKEFFSLKLESIKDAVEEIAGGEADFRTTIAADEYYETLRLREKPDYSLATQSE